MPEFYSTTEIIYLGREVGRGGEGTVYEVADKPQLVAKIYHDPVDADKSEKLRQMVALQNEKLLKLAAWVIDVLRDKPEGKIVGFLMPKINFGTAIHELYNPQSRRQLFPHADWRFLIHAAANLARAFSIIHAHGHAVGDVNHGNVVIGRDATVRLIDCDSYHLNAPGKSYLCEVGVSTHTPPELQNHSLRDVARTGNHDAFGLAVLIFQLLFMGRHPFSGNFQGDGENTLESSIQNQRFAYGSDAAARLMKQPPGTPSLTAVSEDVAKLFERAFLIIENRPTAREWVAGLDALEQNLHQCTINTGHYYLQTLKKCLWCKLEGQTGVLFFPAKFTGNFESDGEFDLYTLGNLIDAIKPPDLAPIPLAATQTLLAPVKTLPPSPVVANAQVNYKLSLTACLVVTAMTVFVVSYAFGFGSIFWLGFAGYWLMSEFAKSILRNPQDEIQLGVDAARQNWQNFKENVSKNALTKTFENARHELKAKASEYRELPRRKEARLKENDAQIYRQQLEFYLNGFYLKDAEIFGLNDERLDLLVIDGVITAAQIDNSNLAKIPNLSHVHKRILLEWRNGLEQKFVFAPSPHLSKKHVEEVENEINTHRLTLETELRGGLPKLQQLSLQLVKKQGDLSLQADKCAADLAQAESDFKRVGDLKTQAIAWMICVAILFFTFGVSVRHLNHQETINSHLPIISNPDVSWENSIGSGSGKGSGTGVPVNKVREPLISYPTTEISTSWGKAGEYYQTGERFFGTGDYRKAIIAYERAARANPKIFEIYNKMGEAYFQLAQYGDAIESYQKALKIEPTDSDSWHKLGLVYNKINRSDEALAAFKKAVENNLSAELSYYELGRNYLKTDNQSLALKQYDLLDKMHSPLAEKLWQEIKDNEGLPAPMRTKSVINN